VDRDSRVALPLSFRIHAPVTGMRSQDLLPAGQIFRDELLHPCSGSWRARLRAVRDYAKYWYSGAGKRNIGAGRVLIYNEDLTRLAEIADDSLDAVVAVSSLEHNAPERLPLVVNEIMRVLKPGGLLLATLGAARDQDWWHVPSSGWNYTETSLRRLFELPLDTPSNYTEFDQIFASLRDCAELRDNLAGFYFQSGQNGMPWGKWDPQYQSVGVRKQKLLRTVSSKL
jgi:SAM-dependent methyltransferase